MSRRLVTLYLVAAALIVLGVTAVVGAALYFSSSMTVGVPLRYFLAEYAPVLIATAIGAALLIGGATAFKTAALSSGGGSVAAGLGGTQVAPDVQDPLRRRLRNVVEEMAIASGTPVPEIYVLEQEDGINAFAAGYEPGDAAIAVTRGALELLDRDELQGVIGHEFSHILNGDMRLNIRLMGVLFGILVLGLIGRTILRGGRYGAFSSSRRGKGAGAVLVVGLGLAILGGVGVLFARIIKAGVSRQREYLADASAVQFTRQTTGIANALKKIGGYGGHSYLRAADPEEVSHMLFGSGAKLSSMFATHPPLTARIQALDPSFDPDQYPDVDDQTRLTVERSAAADSGLTSAFAAGGAAPLRESIVDMVGDTQAEHVVYAAGIRESIPVALYDAAHSPEIAYFLVIALILDRGGPVLEQQLAICEQQLGAERTRMIRHLHEELGTTGPEYRLPLLGVAFPALKRRPLPQLSFLSDLVNSLIDVDGEVDLYEYCFYRVLTANIAQASDPARTRPLRKVGRKPVREAAVNLLRVIARYGHPDDTGRADAFSRGMTHFGKWGEEFAYDAGRQCSTADLDESLDILLALNSEGKEMLLQAVTEVVMSDDRLSIAEAELIRAICASLNCPLPPILVQEAVG